MISRAQLINLTDYLNGYGVKPWKPCGRFYDAIINTHHRLTTDQRWDMHRNRLAIESGPIIIDFIDEYIEILCDLQENETCSLVIKYRGQSDEDLINSLNRLYCSRNADRALGLLRGDPGHD